MHFWYWDCSSVLARNWYMKSNLKYSYQLIFFSSHHVFLSCEYSIHLRKLLMALHEEKRNGKVITKGNMVCSLSVVALPLARTIHSIRKPLISIHVEVNTSCLVAGRTGHTPLALLAQHFRGFKKHHLKALKHNSNFLHQWKKWYIPCWDPPSVEECLTEKKNEF